MVEAAPPEREHPVLDNGSGLSRQERISALALARLLQLAYRSAYMPEFMASLPIAGVDGTLRRSPMPALGSAHLKTGSLSNVLARAGYVDAASGKRYVLVAIINHANAQAARKPPWMRCCNGRSTTNQNPTMQTRT